jgi:CheY-like chemotaxis protein
MSQPADGRPLILVVEDNEVEREGLATILRREGYAVALAADGRKALDVLRQSPPDLILLDMLMPVMDGWAFLEELRGLGPPAPVVVMSPAALTREWARDHGCAGIVHTPVATTELLAELQRCRGE